jgi:hypothetical protein
MACSFIPRRTTAMTLIGKPTRLRGGHPVEHALDRKPTSFMRMKIAIVEGVQADRDPMQAGVTTNASLLADKARALAGSVRSSIR